MRIIRKGSHTKYELKYHFAWITKYRYPVLQGKIALRVRALVRMLCAEHDVIILSGRVVPTHVHIFVSAPPNLAPAKLIQYVKGATSRKIQQEFPELKKRYWGQHFWARGYFVASSGTITDETILEYFKHHDEQDSEDDFKIARFGL